MAHPKHQSVRRRYDFRCGYCGVSEIGAGGDLTVDHYYPASLGGGDEDSNLVYACWRCNLAKSDFWPVPANPEYRILHPLYDDISLHIQEDVLTGQLEPLTATGRAHIRLLQLNREALIANRLERNRALLSVEVADSLLRELEEEKTLTASLRRKVAQWEQMQNAPERDAGEAQE